MKPLEKLVLGPKVCPTHHDDKLWVDEPDTRRYGWIKTTCRICKSTIGYRPINIKKTSRRQNWDDKTGDDHDD